MADIRGRTADIPGALIEVTKPAAGPPTGKPITIEIGALDPATLYPAAQRVAEMLRGVEQARDVDDGLPLPGVDWTLVVDKAEAARYGANALTVGNVVQLVTNGLKVTEYRPDTTDTTVDVLVRFPEDRRSLDQLDELRINTPVGSVPIANFVTREPVERVGLINRVDGRRVVTVTSNVAEGVQSAAVQAAVMERLAEMDLGAGITWRMKGEDEEREKAGAFLTTAFGAALFLIFAILLAQFNRFSSVLITLSAVVMSTIGVLIGLMVMGQAFGVVMTGIGIIANAGVIVNNNIVLIDTYDRLRAEGIAAREAILRTCRERARPGDAHSGHGGAGRARHRLRGEHRHRQPGDRRGRALDAMVGAPVHRHRLRPVLRDPADADRHPGHADGAGEPRGVEREPQGPARGAQAGADRGEAGDGRAGPPSSRRSSSRRAISGGGPQDQLRRLVGAVPHRVVAAVREPVQVRSRKRLHRPFGLGRATEPVVAAPADGDRPASRDGGSRLLGTRGEIAHEGREGRRRHDGVELPRHENPDRDATDAPTACARSALRVGAMRARARASGSQAAKQPEGGQQRGPEPGPLPAAPEAPPGSSATTGSRSPPSSRVLGERSALPARSADQGRVPERVLLEKRLDSCGTSPRRVPLSASAALFAVARADPDPRDEGARGAQRSVRPFNSQARRVPPRQHEPRTKRAGRAAATAVLYRQSAIFNT